MKVVVATDKFRGSLTGPQAAAAITAGLRRAAPGVEVVRIPVADGGEGTVDAAVAAGHQRIGATVGGPTGEPVAASIALSGDTAVVEMAEASGLGRLPAGPAPLTATSYGTGELILLAVDAGARRIVLGIGGSACTDGGAGMAAALGVRFLDAAGEQVPPGGAALRHLDRIDRSGLDPRLAGVEVTVATDVDNPLVGPHGAAAVYGPQKGAGPGDVRVLDEALRHYADRLADGHGTDLCDRPGTGAAGGLGVAALAFLNARLTPGVGLLLDLLGFSGAVPGAALVITGEGSLDEQSLRGKVPVGVAAAAAPYGVPVVALAGRVQVPGRALRAAGIRHAYALGDIEPDSRRWLPDAAELLERLAEHAGREWLQAVLPPAR